MEKHDPVRVKHLQAIKWESLHLFRRSNREESFFLRRETESKENAIFFKKKYKIMKIATNFEV